MQSLLRTLRHPAILAACVFAAAGGCVPAPSIPARQMEIVMPPPREIPVANLPEKLREWNWTDSGGSGSCVHASTVYHLRWQNQIEWAQWWRDNHAGGETDSSIRRYLDRAGLEYEYTLNADPEFLQKATDSRRGAIIWFYPYHCVHFCGLAEVDGRKYAFICDNNRVEQYIRVEFSEFVRRWKEYGGFALSVTSFSPVPPPLYPAWRPR